MQETKKKPYCHLQGKGYKMRIVFIADNFVDDKIGGAELSIQSHIDTCPFEYIKVRCKELLTGVFYVRSSISA